MKQLYYLLKRIFCLTIFITSFNSSKACVDYHPDSIIWTTVVFDSSYQHIEITIHNMELFGGSAGQFCTCALGSYSNIFTDIYYVAFVDSGTTNPIAGFVPWTANAASSASWNIQYPTDWAGFVAEVTSSGLPPGFKVDLIVRANLPAGYTWSLIDTLLYSSTLGSDEWDNNNSQLALTHNSISGLGSTYLNFVPDSYFTGIEEIAETEMFNIYPNPASDQLFIQVLKSFDEGEIVVTDLTGRELIILKTADLKTLLDLSALAPGFYYLNFSTLGFRSSKKFIVTR